MGEKIGARRRMFGGSGEDHSFARHARRSVRSVVLWAMLASLVSTFPPDLAGQSAESGQAEYLRRSRLRSRLREALTLFGDRLERPGKERLTLAGTLRLASPADLPFRAVWELPGRLRIETPLGVLTANGQILTGVVTQGCVESTARAAAFRDYYVVVAEDCVATYDRELHEASLKVLRTRVDVAPSDEVLRVWGVA